MTTILNRLSAQAARTPDAPALLAPGRKPASYRDLLDQARSIGSALAAHDISRGDRVVVLLRNGPEMAASFLAVAGVASCAPLNPAYTENELNFYFDDLQPKGLLCDPSLPSAAMAIAKRRGIAVLEVSANSSLPAGRYALSRAAAAEPAAGLPEDIALLLHTSGTTSRPKLVPLTQANLLASAAHIADTLALTSGDRCFNIMPLFHIHGLIGGLLSSMLSGASVVCTAGFDPENFYAQLGESQPSWITAVPTMYEQIARLSAGPQHSSAAAKLRFLRSSSASLPPRLMRTLEDVFGVPVIEAYGMTEAAHQMACNPLPPRARKPGSVGVAAGPEIAIMSPDGPELLPRGTTGEIVIRGPNVTGGYLGNPEASAKAFSKGWFRTGDQGAFDADGYLFISGRLKELINRGGEKISPREVDEALLALPGVRQAVAFAVPHATLGEDVAAAVVPAEGATLDADALRRQLSDKLSAFKVPSRIVFVDVIPKGPTGKLQRIGLAQLLADKLRDEYVAPSNELEQQLAMLWQEVLDVPQVGVTSNFFALGGDSLRAIRIASRAAELGLALPVDAVFREPMIAGLARLVTPLIDPSVPDERALGRVRLYGFQRVILQATVATPEHFASPTEVVLESNLPFDRAAIAAAARALLIQHDAFRLRYTRPDGRWVQELLAAADVTVEQSVLEAGAGPFAEAVREAHRGFELARPPLFRFLAVDGAPHRLVIVAHHAVADAMAMQIVGEDFVAAYEQAEAGTTPIVLPNVPTPFAAYVRRYDAAAKAGRFHPDAARWLACDEKIKQRDDLVGRKPFTFVGTVRHQLLELAEHTQRIQRYAREHRMSVSEVLFAATVTALREIASPSNHARVLMMSNGRDQQLLGNLSRTVGCLVNLVPVLVDLNGANEFDQVAQAVCAALHELPSAGLSLPANLSGEPAEVRMQIGKMLFECQALFNYKGVLGPRSALALDSARFAARPCTYRAEDMIAMLQSPEDPMAACFAIQVHYELADGKLFGDWYYANDMYSDAQITRLIEIARNAIERIPA